MLAPCWLRLAAALIPGALLFACADSSRLPAPLPSAAIVSGRERCAVAPSGAPDCGAAVNALCRAKGFAAGTSIDTQTEYCLDRARGAVGNCAFVTRAACR
jgi:hypothetical protein